MFNKGRKNSEDSYESMVSSSGGVESIDFDDAIFQYQFTRHANSCNNDNAGKVMGKDNEPGLTDRGIMETIKQSQAEGNRQYYNSNNVFVSCLYRTWCTAVLLYSNGSEKELTLNISPFMKEKHEKKMGKTLRRGNHPKELTHMVEKFRLFLNYVKNKHPKFASKMPKNIVLNVYEPIKYNITTTRYNYYNNEYNITRTDVCSKKEDPIMATENVKGFQKDGDLQNFLNWHCERFKCENNNNKNPVHVVSHSKIMRAYVISKGWEEKVIEPTISETNCCMIRTKIDATKDDIKFKKGYSKKCPEGESCTKGGDLCGSTGSIKPICSEQKSSIFSMFTRKNNSKQFIAKNPRVRLPNENNENFVEAGGKKKKHTRKIHKKHKKTKKVVKKNKKRSLKKRNN
jgi:hypothetical protein